MKKNLFYILGFLLITVAILASIYYNYQKKLLIASKINSQYEEFTKNTIVGSQLMTLINKVTDQNEKNKLQKDEKGRYIENTENSIIIEVKFLESEETYRMEAISYLGSESFIKNYNSMSFKCTKVERHNKTNQIKYILFEQI